MPNITITNPTTPVVPPTAIPEFNLTANGNGEIHLQTANITNDGNTVNTVSWNLSDLLNGSLVSIQIETDSVQAVSPVGTKTINPGQSFSFHFFINVPAGAPGATNPNTTANFVASWV